MWCAAARIANPGPEPNRPEIRLVTFNYAAGRDMGVASKLLEDFRGTLMTDAYAAYESPARVAHITHAACMAHVRRYFHDTLKVQKNNPKAQKAMAFISALYDVERDLASKGPEELLKARQERSRPIMAAFWTWLTEEAKTVLPKSTLGKAILYTIPLWERLCVYLGDPKVPIDNNIAENAIRPFAVGRRNWLFFDQDEGAEASTSFYTLIETARANDMEPMHYLRFLFNCIEHFGQDAMPWENLMPTPALRSYADSIGIPYAMGL
jgi:transposase